APGPPVPAPHPRATPCGDLDRGRPPAAARGAAPGRPRGAARPWTQRQAGRAVPAGPGALGAPRGQDRDQLGASPDHPGEPAARQQPPQPARRHPRRRDPDPRHRLRRNPRRARARGGLVTDFAAAVAAATADGYPQPPAANTDQVTAIASAFARLFELRLPDDYRAFLLTCNG